MRLDIWPGESVIVRSTNHGGFWLIEDPSGASWAVDGACFLPDFRDREVLERWLA